MSAFDAEAVLPTSLLKKITDLRIVDPGLSMRVANARARRNSLTARGGVNDGRLLLIAMDHPARGVTRVGDAPLGMANRRDLLARIMRAMQADTVDGILASMDILEDLFVLHELLPLDAGGRFLDNKVVLASFNRGGLAGAAWELDDPMTGASAQTCSAWNLDGGKVLLRVALEERDSLKTLESVARTVTEMNAEGLPTFLEPLVVSRVEGQWKVDTRAEPNARLVGIASALGDSSRLTWLKVPFMTDLSQVAQATTLPMLLLGGESAGDARPLLRDIDAGLRAGHNVRGALVGRNVLFAGAADPLAVARAAGGLIHQGWSLAKAEELS